MREIHWFDLPWPTDALEGPGATPVRVRVTLSHFIEPNPSRRGWQGRFHYASHGLRFALKLPTESIRTFERRLSRKALNEDNGEKRPKGSDSDGWLLGPQLRSGGGSLLTDIWAGHAADLAEPGSMSGGVPRHRLVEGTSQAGSSDLGVRYGLVVSIESPRSRWICGLPYKRQIATVIETPT